MEVGRLALTLVELAFFVNAAAELPDQVVGAHPGHITRYPIPEPELPEPEPELPNCYFS
jgi:hypothetical protein